MYVYVYYALVQDCFAACNGVSKMVEREKERERAREKQSLLQ